MSPGAALDPIPLLKTTHMDNTTFGLTMLLVGMGGTLLTLWILAILIGWLTRLCQPSAKGGTHE
jgi:hypothetical protein